MAKDYKQNANNARKRSTHAKASSAQHGRDLDGMRKRADDAASNLQQAKAHRKKREDFSQAAARIVTEATKGLVE